MVRYILKRLLLFIPVVIGVAFVIFTIMQFQPGNPGRMILGINAPEEAVEKLNDTLGCNRPFLERFFSYVFNLIFHADFGISYRTSEPVVNDIASRVGISFHIAFNGIAFASVVGILLGVICAVKQYSFIDNFFRVLAIIFSGIPGFWLGMILIYLFSIKLQWLPSNGVENGMGYILPMLTLGSLYSGITLRMTRSSMLETLRSDYIRTAKAKGVPRSKIIFHYALRNALLPVITTLITSFGGLLGGAIITETVFNLPGLGLFVVSAIRNRDIPCVLGGTITLAFLFCAIMLLADLLYAFIDPRIKAKYTK